MAPDNSIKKFARTSLRLNRLLIVSFSLLFVLIGITYWVGERLVQEQLYKVQLHFDRLVGGIHEQETFLQRIARPTDEATQRQNRANVPIQLQKLKDDQGYSLYEGKEFSFAMPFMLAIPSSPEDPDGKLKIGKLGVLISNFYGSYWSTSPYSAPQTYILDLDSKTSIAVPAADFAVPRGRTGKAIYANQSEGLKDKILKVDKAGSDGSTRWTSVATGSGATDVELIVYMHTRVPKDLWLTGSEEQRVVVASVLDFSSIREFFRLGDWAVFDSVGLITPSGLLLTGSDQFSHEGADGLSFDKNGFLVKVTSSDGWKGFYYLSYRTFAAYAKWQFFMLLSICVVLIVAGYLIFRWYAFKVVAPARNAHDLVVESDKFGRAIIQGAPVGLCILGRKSRKVVMENELALQWVGDTAAISRLSRSWDFDNDVRQESKRENSTIVLNGRQLEVRFSNTRYKGEDVVLCAFTDITTYKLAEKALAEAKQSADASNEAKSIFLATMSHEIRTPLYGVLGTLELLMRSQLNSQQRSQVLTMQRSSSILLQVISDILDVSKIEAGQLAIECLDFNLLEMIEDVVQSYSASARSKKLTFYACIDSHIPTTLQGDPSRIRQVLNNLISNAIKFTDVGRIVLRVTCENFAGVSNLSFQVADSGAGITQECQSRLFEPFYQIHDHHQIHGGTGLGLSICSRLTKLMGGTLDVVSEYGHGSSFTLRLSLKTICADDPASLEIKFSKNMVVVRSPVKELANNLCEWLVRYGANAVVARHSQANVSSNVVLLDVTFDDVEVADWSGEHVVCTPDASVEPARASNGYLVNMYSFKGILRAVALAQGDSAYVAEINEASSRWSRLSLNVLVAEDNPINQTLLREQLEELGCTAVVAHNGLEAMQLWEQEAFDIVLTDVNMPEMNGYEFTAALRKVDVLTPIVGVTANAMREEGERCVAVGMNACVVKPISLQTLHDVLIKLCGHLDGAVIPAEIPLPKSQMQVSDTLRSVFITTLSEDISQVRQCLLAKNGESVCSLLHRVRGGLVVVQAQDLQVRCESLEKRLRSEGWSDEAGLEVDVLLEEILDEMNKI
ncbi:hybrid sensor histidine kinase/response regulator [Pseudomonas sp. Irchel 3H7]|uniref:hybrid sensor histidine kinase/response regulator n=1 Tax=Pseudomonas sp. Irchel 3H7 TaxID=2009042 RepID=UPI000BA2D8CC|nr:hybrid sensor histidine kinase/response regulator [Pseudomonas sp. Irchel 3H7]